MRLTVLLTIVWSVVLGSSTYAQEAAVPTLNLDVGATEWMVTAGPAFGFTLFHSTEGHKYFLQSLSWGRVLTRAVGPLPLRGRFQWSVELIPLYSQYDPESTFGIGVTPLYWRWNFEPRGRLVQFVELAGGALWTRDPVPARTTTANFTGHAAYGVRYVMRPNLSVVASFGLHHISNGNRLEENPGVNAHVMQVGLSLLRPR